MSVTGTDIVLTLRQVKGSQLSYDELDNNQSGLKAAVEGHSHDEFDMAGAADTSVDGHELENDHSLLHGHANQAAIDLVSGTNTGDQDLSGYSLTSHDHTGAYQPAGDYATLVGGTVPASQLPSYVDGVLEYTDFASLPITGEAGKIYVTLDANLTYRWSGSAYVEISKSLALGETELTAYRGDRGKSAYDHSQSVHAKTTAIDAIDHAALDHTGLTGIPTAYTLPTASTTVLGGVKIDGTSITIADGVISSSGGSGILSGIDWSNPVSVTTTATLVAGKHHVCSGTTVDYTVTLPAVSGNAGKLLSIEMSGALTKLVALNGNGSELIDGSQTRIMWAKETAVLLCDGVGWTKIAGKSIPMVACIRANANQLITVNVITKLNFGANIFDTLGMSQTSTSEIIIKRPSKYSIDAILTSNITNSQAMAIRFYTRLNGVNSAFSSACTYSAGAFCSPKITSIVDANTNDVITASGYFNAGSFTTSFVYYGSEGATELLVTELNQW